MGTTFAPGRHTVTITATDKNGLQDTCTFAVNVNPAPLSFVVEYGDRTVASQKRFPPNEDLKALLEGDFVVKLVTTPSSISAKDPVLSVAPLRVGQPWLKTKNGFQFGMLGEDQRFPIALNDGANQQYDTFALLRAYNLGQKYTTEVAVVRKPDGGKGRTVTLRINGVLMGTLNFDRITGESLYPPNPGSGTGNNNDNGYVILGAGLATFRGELTRISITAANACSSAPCGVRAKCQINSEAKKGYTCQCLPQFAGSAIPGASGEGCVDREVSCASCAKAGEPSALITDSTCGHGLDMGRCMGAMNFEQATQLCHNKNGRLCGRDELPFISNFFIQRCALTDEEVWTRDTCDNGGKHFTTGAGKDGMGDNCRSDSSKRRAFCCFDRAPQAQSDRTCSELGWKVDNPTAGSDSLKVCAASKLPVGNDFRYNGVPTCSAAVTFRQAEVICAVAGARLCNIIELVVRGEAKSEDCALNSRRVWSATGGCPAGKARVVPGSPTAPQDIRQECVDETLKFKVRCCADVGETARARSSKTCQVLGWEPGYSSQKICGHSFEECAFKGSPPPQSEMRTYKQADEYCNAKGARMCTLGEVLAGETQSTGCNYDESRIWTSSPCRTCGTNGFYTHAGTLAAKSKAPLQCTASDSTGMAFVRCCADSQVQCSRAGGTKGCTGLNREPCTTTVNTCGSCRAGFAGTTGPSNADDCKDVEKPVVECPDPRDAEFRVETQAQLKVKFDELVKASDNVGIAQTIFRPPSGTTLRVGRTPVKFTAFDAAGNSASCDFLVTVAGPSACKPGFTQLQLAGGTSGNCEQCPPGTYTEAGTRGQCERYACPVGMVDEDKDPSTPCTECPFGTFINTPGRTSCIEATKCGDGEIQVSAPTTSSDRTCFECTSDTFKDPTTGRCAPHLKCKVGERESVSPTSSTDRLCEPCPKGFFQDIAGQTTCKQAIDTCGPGFEETSAPTASSDRVCSPCDDGYFKLTAGVFACQACTTQCATGKFRTACSSTADAQCLSCPPGTYNDDVTATTCKPQVTCSVGQYRVSTGTASAATVCSTCSTCPEGQHRTGGCDGIVDTTCVPCETQADCGAGNVLTGRCRANALVGPKCENCDPTCRECSGIGSHKCTSCRADLNLHTDGTCVGTCAERFYATDASSCANCDDSCLTCSGPGATDCLSCPPDTHLQKEGDGDRCVKDCTDGQYHLDKLLDLCRPCTVCPTGTFAASACTPTADTKCRETRACAAGEYEIRKPSSIVDRRCGDCKACAAGEYAKKGDDSCNGAFDTVCLSCPTGFYSPDGVGECRPWTVCPPGQKVTQQPSASRDRVCQPCAAGTTDASSNNQCVPCTQPGSYVPPGSVGSCTLFGCPEGTADSDGSAATPCAECDGIYQYQPLTSQAVCLSVDACKAGEKELQAPTKFSNRICGGCDGVTEYQDSNGISSECKSVTQCTDIQWELAAPTSKTDRQCLPLSPCGPNEYQVEAPVPGVSDYVCARLRACDATEYLASRQTATSDRVCNKLTICGDHEWESAAAKSDADRICTPITPCKPVVEFESRAPTSRSDRECTAVTVCGDDEYELAKPTSTSDRECVAHSDCPDGQYELVAPHGGADRVCERFTVCGSNEFEAQRPTATSDRMCKPIERCPHGEFQVAEATPTSPTQCAPFRECVAGEWETAAPTEMKDRECAVWTICTSSEYQLEPPSSMSDRVCKKATICVLGVETSPPTATMDRVCTSITNIIFNGRYDALVFEPDASGKKAQLEANIRGALERFVGEDVVPQLQVFRTEDGFVNASVTVVGEDETQKVRDLMDAGQLSVRSGDTIIVANPYSTGLPQASTAGQGGDTTAIVAGVVAGVVVLGAIVAFLVYKSRRGGGGGGSGGTLKATDDSLSSFANPMYSASPAGEGISYDNGGYAEPDLAEEGAYDSVQQQVDGAGIASAESGTGYMSVTPNAATSQDPGYLDVAENPESAYMTVRGLGGGDSAHDAGAVEI